MDMNKRVWELKQSATPGTIELYIYDDIEKGYYDWWSEKQIESETSQDYFKNKLEEFSDAEYINIYINSWGGDVMEAYGICAQLQRHKAYKTAYIDGFAASAASLIPMICDKVVMYSNTMMMIHEIASGMYGNAEQHEKEAETLRNMMVANRQLYLNKGNIDEDELIKLLKGETWLTAQQCYDYGLCDEILGVKEGFDSSKYIQKANKSLQAQLQYRTSLLQSFNSLSIKQKTVELDPATIEQKRIDDEKEANRKQFASFFQALLKQQEEK